jgi:Polyketide cyclase / dehydrase and lipid transport
MGRYVITRRIGAAPEQVFRAFTDPALVADWMDASAVENPTGPLDVPGSRYTLVIRGPWRFRTTVIRSEPPWLHETAGSGPLGGSYRMVATLSAADGGTGLELLTEYAIPLGPIGRWIDRRWVDREPHPTANREVDRLVTLVSAAV